MIRYTMRRLLLLIPTIFCVILIVFIVMSVIPGDPGRLVLGVTATKEAVDMFNARFGLDLPFPVRFLNYLTGIVTRFDFGVSYRSLDPVMPGILMRFPTTLTVAFFSVLTALLIGVPLGVLAAVRHSTVIDTSVTVFSLFLAAIPSFWFGLMLLYLFAVTLMILPTHGADNWKGFVLPVLAMAVPSSSGFMRLTRVTMLGVVNAEYIRTARAKGSPEYKVIWKHAFRNAAVPLINGAGLMFSALLGGAVIIEQVFSLPGLGRHLVTAITQRDIPVVMGCTIFLSFTFMIIILLIDILYAALDPRIRLRYTKAAKAGKKQSEPAGA